MSGIYDGLESFVLNLIAKNQRSLIAAGTIVSVDNTVLCTVQFDGSANVEPVRIYRNVRATPGERVGLVRVGSDWWVFGTAGEGVPNIKSFYTPAVTAGTTTSVTFVDAPGPTDYNFVKRYDYTNVQVQFARTSFITPASRFQGWGMAARLDGVQVAEVAMAFPFADENNFHEASHGIGTFTGGLGAGQLRAGTYSMRVRWRTQTASTTGVNADDEYYVKFMETFT